MAGWGVNVMKDHIRKQTSSPDRRVRRTEAEAQRSEAFSPTQHRCTCKNFTVSKKTPEPTCVYKRKRLLLLLFFFFGLSSRSTASRSPALPTETNQTLPIPSYSCRQRGSRLCSADVEAKSGQAGERRRDAPSSHSAPGPPRRAGPNFHPTPSDQMPKDPARVSRQFERIDCLY